MSNAFTLAVTGQSLIKHDIRAVEGPGFRGVRELLQKADLSFTNFEGTILGRHGGWPLKGSFFGCSDPVVLDALQALGFQALSLSNNHAFDLGPSGVLSTLEEVERRGFVHAGIGRNHTEAARAGLGSFRGRKVAIVAMDGGPGPDLMYAADSTNNRPARPGVNRLRLAQVLDVDDDAFERLRTIRDKVGYTAMDLTNDSQPDDPLHIDVDTEINIARAIFRRSDKFGRNVKIDEGDISQNLATIASAAAEGCFVIAYLHHHHWASDWYQVPGWVSAVAKQCIDAGATMFVSHGAPVLQPVEIYRGRPIFYSLGNFIFHVRSEKSLWTAPEVWESVVGMCSFGEDNHLLGLTFHPVIIGGSETSRSGALEGRLVPQLAGDAEADRILGRFREHSAKLGTDIEVAGGVGFLNI
ncbi:CapA family protein [Rhizobiaceae bacterium n13]|uniref:CapA family protein n=1 Tax=Ferirhizobium litorale TaxID=2927786 RepID=A0AAE3QBP3_9HYPH|nr:CapA family protein [Fererhizobium litorale]MDI7861911.1 CapA family protein [Fererhizobium litorale]MDI7922817.1 CapA family protein [Fererhizobium litorale]